MLAEQPRRLAIWLFSIALPLAVLPAAVQIQAAHAAGAVLVFTTHKAGTYVCDSLMRTWAARHDLSYGYNSTVFGRQTSCNTAVCFRFLMDRPGNFSFDGVSQVVFCVRDPFEMIVYEY